MLAALTGMRRGELCALRWTDVDLELGTLDVSRSVVVVVGGVAEKSTKTDRSRKVALDVVGMALLKRHLAQVTTWLAQASGGELPPDAFVFSPLVESTVPFRPDKVTSFFIRVRTVADFLGDSDPSLTLRVYSHAIEERTRAAAAIMGQVLGAQKKQPALPSGR